MALHLSVEQYAEIKMTLPTLQKADRAMDDHLLPASQMWKNSCRIMYQMILLSNCYQNREKTPQTLDISRRLGQWYLFPLDGAAGLRSQIQQHAVDAVDLMGDAVGDLVQDRVGDLLDGGGPLREQERC